MARGFESKSVASQQENAQARAKPRPSAEESDASVVLKRKRLELARVDVLHQMQLARAEGHKEMLRRALAALEKDLASLG